MQHILPSFEELLHSFLQFVWNKPFELNGSDDISYCNILCSISEFELQSSWRDSFDEIPIYHASLFGIHNVPSNLLLHALSRSLRYWIRWSRLHWTDQFIDWSIECILAAFQVHLCIAMLILIWEPRNNRWICVAELFSKILDSSANLTMIKNSSITNFPYQSIK